MNDLSAGDLAALTCLMDRLGESADQVIAWAITMGLDAMRTALDAPSPPRRRRPRRERSAAERAHLQVAPPAGSAAPEQEAAG